MSLDKSIKFGKEHRKNYRGSKRYARSCRNHGDCPYCMNNRMHSSNKRLSEYDFNEKELLKTPILDILYG